MDINKGNNFKESFEQIGATFQVHFNLATWSNYSIINYVKILVFHFSEKWLRDI